MTEQSWDPLSFSEKNDPEIFNAATKRQIQNILKSYVGRFDPFCELIQNAMDSVDKRAREEKANPHKKHIWITINLQANQLSVTDNGLGFKESEFKSFLAPNVSYKESGKSRGHKGVGATYIAYGFNFLQIGTKRHDYQFIGELEGGRDWVEDSQGIVTRPHIKPSKIIDPYFDVIDRGATFTINFGSESSKHRDLAWLTATTPKQWSYLLLAKTPLGTIEKLIDSKEEPIAFTLKVITKEGSESVLDTGLASYLFPHLEIAHSTDLKEVAAFQKKRLEQGKDSAVIPAKYTKANGIYEFFNFDETKALLKDSSTEEIDLINKHKPEVYAYFAYSTSVWTQLNDDIAKLRKGIRFLRGGLQIANNKMIQGEPLVIPLTSNIGYQNQCYVIVHYSDADPDLGRKGFQPELKEIAERLSVGVVNKLRGWKERLLKQDTGAKGTIQKEAKLDEWIKEQETHEKSMPLSITNPNFFEPTNEISITSVPRSEQDVIVLFNQLVAGGVIRGLKLLATSQFQQYDGLYRYYVKKPLDTHIFDKKTNPLGVSELTHSEEFQSKAKILEYKFSLDSLVHEFECGEKRPDDIQLVICWEIGWEYKKDYTPTSLLDLDHLNHREFHGITHLLSSSTSTFHVVCLKELIEYLNGVDGVQEYQKETYGDDIA